MVCVQLISVIANMYVQAGILHLLKTLNVFTVIVHERKNKAILTPSGPVNFALFTNCGLASGGKAEGAICY